MNGELLLSPDQPPDFEAIPDVSGVFVLWLRQGAPHLGRTHRLRRRLRRLLSPLEGSSRLRALREAAVRVEYQATGSPFESTVLLYGLARKHRPDDYRRFLKLRIPPFLKLSLSHPHPRCWITRRPGRDGSLYFGPFASRAAAERFQSAFLDLFQVRRCREEIVPDPAHPGCIYGEMGMCLRPCQAACTAEQYRAEVGRVAEFLSTRGESLRIELEREREQASAGLEFERAARLHKKLEKAGQAVESGEELARDLERLWGVIVQRSVEQGAVELWFLRQGCLQPRRRLVLAAEGAAPVSLDERLRRTLAELPLRRRPARDRAEQLALVARWHWSSWKQGELILFDDPERPPYRKLARALARVANA